MYAYRPGEAWIIANVGVHPEFQRMGIARYLMQMALDAIRSAITDHLPVRLEARSRVSLFVYDNGTFIAHNFRDEAVEVSAVARRLYRPASSAFTTADIIR